MGMKRVSMLLAATLLAIGGCSEANVTPETTSPPAASTTAAAVATTATPTTVK